MSTSESPPTELPILRVRSSDIPDIAVVVGDPARARRAAEMLDDAAELGSNREYTTLVGERAGVRICVASHGVGASGANVCFSELLRGGVRTLIRAGTCGAITPGPVAGDLILVTGAVREDGASDQLIGLAYPALAHHEIVTALASSARQRGQRWLEGLAVTEANFYPGSEPPRWQRYTDYGAVAVEMEMAALFVLASMHGARAGGILTVDGNLVDSRNPDMSDYDPHRESVSGGVGVMLEIALDAAAASG